MPESAAPESTIVKADITTINKVPRVIVAVVATGAVAIIGRIRSVTWVAVVSAIVGVTAVIACVAEVPAAISAVHSCGCMAGEAECAQQCNDGDKFFIGFLALSFCNGISWVPV